jgi:hypothetical protein
VPLVAEVEADEGAWQLDNLPDGAIRQVCGADRADPALMTPSSIGGPGGADVEPGGATLTDTELVDTFWCPDVDLEGVLPVAYTPAL